MKMKKLTKNLMWPEHKTFFKIVKYEIIIEYLYQISQSDNFLKINQVINQAYGFFYYFLGKKNA